MVRAESMSAGSASTTPPPPAQPTIRAITGEVEFSMFEVLGFDGRVLRVRTPFVLSLGEEVALHVEHIGRTIARVTAHQQEITELTLLSGLADGSPHQHRSGD
jgi:hypothetical protein